jgi:hypothetical protein
MPGFVKKTMPAIIFKAVGPAETKAAGAALWPEQF